MGLATGGGGTFATSYASRPALHLLQSRTPPRSWRLPPLPDMTAAGGFAEARLPLAGGPSGRVLPAMAPHPDHPLGAPHAQVLDSDIIAVAKQKAQDEGVGYLTWLNTKLRSAVLGEEALKDRIEKLELLPGKFMPHKMTLQEYFDKYH